MQTPQSRRSSGPLEQPQPLMGTGEGWHEAGARFIMGSNGAAGDVEVKPEMPRPILPRCPVPSMGGSAALGDKIALHFIKYIKILIIK